MWKWWHFLLLYISGLELNPFLLLPLLLLLRSAGVDDDTSSS